MDEVISEFIGSRRFMMIVLGVFAALGLGLATMGVYGVVSYAVGRRTNEIGIRMALGAKRTAILRLVLGAGMQPALVGILLGIVASFVMTQFLSEFLFHVSAHDPRTIASVAI